MCPSTLLSVPQLLCKSSTSGPSGSTDLVFGGSFHCILWKQGTQGTNVSSSQLISIDKIPPPYPPAYGHLCLIQLNIPQNSGNFSRKCLSPHIWFRYLSYKPLLISIHLPDPSNTLVPMAMRMPLAWESSMTFINPL